MKLDDKFCILSFCKNWRLIITAGVFFFFKRSLVLPFVTLLKTQVWGVKVCSTEPVEDVSFFDATGWGYTGKHQLDSTY